MASVKDSFLDLERHVLQLEANAKELRAALEHWRTWDAEYEALKEDVAATSRDGAREAAALSRVRDGFEGDLVNGKEVAEIFGQGRSASQVLGVLGRRLDYVGTNVRALERKVEEAERKLDAARVVTDPGATDEGGLPITEIFERLDEDGNVLSHELWTPGSKRPQVEEILGKAGVASGSIRQAKAEEIHDTDQDASKTQDQPRLPAKSPPAPEVKPAASALKDSAPARRAEEKKVIAQVEADEASEPEKPEMSKAAQRVQRIMDNAREQEDLSKSEPVMPADESEEDAALRRQMLEYGMSHNAGGMGEVVAVMNDLRFEDSDDDDEFNSFSDVDDDDDDYDDDEDEEGEDEDKWGRTTGRVVSERYQDRMLQLEQRLGVQSRFTRKLAEEAAAAQDGDDLEEGIGRITIRDTGASAEALPKKSTRDAAPPANGALKSDDAPKAKKSVRFAGNLDIAPEPEPASAPAPARTAPKHLKTENPVADLIIEQTAPLRSEPAPETKPRKQSRFKQMTGAAPKPAPREQVEEKKPSEEAGIMNDLSWAETVPERDLRGDVDDEIERREVADEYQRRRRRMIEREGGFLKEDQSEVQKDEARPMSKFRAARLSRQ